MNFSRSDLSARLELRLIALFAGSLRPKNDAVEALGVIRSCGVQEEEWRRLRIGAQDGRPIQEV